MQTYTLSEIIERDGAAAVADVLGVHVTSVHHVRQRRRPPSWRMLAAAVRRYGRGFDLEGSARDAVAVHDAIEAQNDQRREAING